MALTRRICSFTSAGSVASADGPGWGCSKTGTGVYVITFPGTLVVAGPSLCILVCPTQNTAARWARYSNNSVTGTTVTIFDRSGTLVDSAFVLEMCADFV